MCRNPLPVAAAGHAPHPFFILQIPAHGFANSTLKGFPRAPAELSLNFTCIHGVTPVVSGTILHKRDEARRRGVPRVPAISSTMSQIVSTMSMLRFSFHPPML